ARAVVSRGQNRSEIGSREAEAGGEGQIEQRLERRRSAVLLERITANQTRGHCLSAEATGRPPKAAENMRTTVPESWHLPIRRRSHSYLFSRLRWPCDCDDL